MFSTIRPIRRYVPYLLALAWIGTVAAGFIWLWDYAAAPGNAAEAPLRWPRDSQVVPATDRPTLVMFAHPKCVCTRASVAELARTMALCRGRVAAHVLFYKPSQTSSDWERTELWEAAASIPGVKVSPDLDQQEAERFAARTSGQVVLYDASGERLFQGGITPARGHEGDNLGRQALVQLLTGGSSAVLRTPVYGCALGSESPSFDRE
jgi:hypothetical protein